MKSCSLSPRSEVNRRCNLRSTAFLLLIAIGLATACRPKPPAESCEAPGGAKAAESTPAAADAASRATAQSAPAVKPPRPATPPVRPKPAGRPAPSAVSGHAVAFSGWRPDPNRRRDVIQVADPGDNVLAEAGNLWDPQPRDLPIYYGQRRPTVVLEPAGVFTITGAVVVTARGPALPPRRAEIQARAMPDLSQDFHPAWPGLCGPTSMADVLFSMEARGHAVVGDFPRGPGDEADRGVIMLVAGGSDRITPLGLAGRMGVGQEGVGATNTGVRDGAAAWLDEHDPGNWDVSLDWLGDDVTGQAEQQAFFGRLAAAVESGGGAILCLWPGAEFADEAIEEKAEPTTDLAQSEAAEAAADAAASAASSGQAAGDSGADAGSPAAAAGESAAAVRPVRMPELPPLPTAAFPEIQLPEPVASAGLPGSAQPVDDPAAEARQGREKLDAARSRAARGSQRFAYQLAMQAVERLDRAAAAGADCQDDLAAAIEFCRSLEQRLPGGGPTAEVTEYN